MPSPYVPGRANPPAPPRISEPPSILVPPLALAPPTGVLTELADSIRAASRPSQSLQEANRWGVEYFQEVGLSPSQALSTLAEEQGTAIVAAGSIHAFAAANLRHFLPLRLNRARVLASTEGIVRLIKSWDPRILRLPTLPVAANFQQDIEAAIAMGEEGIPIFTDPDFVPSTRSGRCPGKYSAALVAVNAHIHSNVSAGLARVVPFHALSAMSPSPPHLQNFGFVTQLSKRKGRLTSNCSGVAAPAERTQRFRAQYTPGALNSVFVKEEGKRRWGAIQHPSVANIIQMILRAEKLFGADNLVLFKEDIKGFYQLCWFRPSDVHLMAFQVFTSSATSGQKPRRGSGKAPPSMVCFSLAGNFGWAALPMAMEVITRLLRVIVGIAIFGFMCMYVDDLIMVSTLANWRQDRDNAIQAIENLLGPNSHAPEKSDSTASTGKSSRHLDVLGWNIDLSTRLVSMSLDNHQRTLSWFLEVNVSLPLSLERRERLCSLAERYSLVYPELRVLMYFMYSMLGGKHRMGPAGTWALTDAARLGISAWQTYLLTTEWHRRAGRLTGRSFDYFAIRPVGGTIEFDGSLDGLGWRLFLPSGDVFVAGYFLVPTAHLPSRDSSYQNTMELTALALAILHAASIGWKHLSIIIRGDSKTANHWATKSQFNSTNALSASILLVEACRHFDIHIHSSTWISSEDNAICDHLSRGRIADATSGRSCGPQPVLDASSVPHFQRALEIAAPTVLVPSLESFSSMWMSTQSVVTAFHPSL